MKLYKIVVLALSMYSFFIYPYNPEQNNILLIINYNHPYYYSIPFLRELYAPAFHNIVFYGPEAHPDVNQVFHNKGWFGYMALADAMQRFPGYEGYFCVGDDLILSYWNLVRFDCEKIWWCGLMAIHAASDQLRKNPWQWWRRDVGYKALKNVLNELPQHYLEQLERSLGKQNVCCGMADAMYFPARYKDEIINFCSLAEKHKLFLEIAMPMMCVCLTSPSEIQSLNVLYLWGNDRARYKQRYNRQLDGLHPIKLSSPDAREFVVRQFNA